MPATTLIEALAGIAVPCDLLPLTSVEGGFPAGRDDELSGKRSAFPTTRPGDVVLGLRL